MGQGGVSVRRNTQGCREKRGFYKELLFPAEALRFYRLPLSLFTLAVAAFTALLAGMAAGGVEPDERGALCFLVAVDSAAILFLAFCLWQLSHRGLLLEEDCFWACGWRRCPHQYSEVGSILLVPKTMASGRGWDIPVMRNREPVLMLFLIAAPVR